MDSLLGLRNAPGWHWYPDSDCGECLLRNNRMILGKPKMKLNYIMFFLLLAICSRLAEILLYLAQGSFVVFLIITDLLYAFFLSIADKTLTFNIKLM